MATKTAYEGEPITRVLRTNTCCRPCSRNVATLSLCLIVYFCCNMTLSMLGPFFPIEAEARGAGAATVGAIMSTYPTCVIVASPIIGYYLPKMGVKYTLLAGTFLLGGSTVLFAFLYTMSGTIFIVFSFLLAFVGGIGSAMLQTSNYALAGMLFTGHYGLVMGLMEVTVGLGYAAGAPIVGILYEAGGFMVPFLVLGSIPLCFLIIMYMVVASPADICQTDQLSLSIIGKAMKSCIMICLVLSTITGTMSLSFSSPIFSPFMYTQFHLSIYQIGLISLLDAGTYFILCLLTGPLYDRLPPKPFIVAGLLLCSVGCFFLGPAPYIGKPQLWLVMLSDGILGVGVALIIAPVFSAMMGVVSSQCTELSANSVTMFVSGIIPAAISCGELVGPLVAGILDGIMNFQECSALFGEANLAMAVLLMAVIAIDWIWTSRGVKKHNAIQLLVESNEPIQNYKTFSNNKSSSVQKTIL